MTRYAILCLAALLGGCSSDASAPAPAPTDVAASAPAPTAPAAQERRVLALGDSLFAGYGLRSGESYPARLEAALRARGINARIANAGVSGDTTAAGLQRLAFTLSSQKTPPELVIISLGGNDLLRGISPEQTRDNLDAILTELDRRGIRAMLMGLMAPPNLGADYAREYDAIFPALARKHDAALVPFFLEPLVDRPDLRQADMIHPTAQGIDVLVERTVEAVAGALGPAPAEATAPAG